MTRERLLEIIEEAGFEDVRDDYSGRGMYGATCPAFVVAGGEELAAGARLLDLAKPGERTQLLKILKHVCSDHMGKSDMILYFPQFKGEPR